MDVHAVVLSTAGNQSYVFGSNKRRENVGASHLITRVEGEWLDRALAAVGASRPDGPGGRRGGVEEDGIEVVTANAGGVTLLVRDAVVGRRVVGVITEAALREAPGLDVCGAVGGPVAWGKAAEVARGIADARERLVVARARRRGPRLRFPGVPIAARCESSGLPARRAVRLNGERRPEARSAPSLAKLDAFDPALLRLAVKMGLCEPGGGQGTADAREKLVRIVEYLNDKAEWVAVVHADGNGLGKVFQKTASVSAAAAMRSADEFTGRLRALSEGVDECALQAFRWAFRKVRDGGWSARTPEPPVLPLILGGDDLTVVCDGELALPFARHYLEEFARLTGASDTVGGALRQGTGRRGLGACAGVAIVKRHYPFHSAVQLAEELTVEAKTVKGNLGQDRSALSFHVLFESTYADLNRLRGQQTVAGEGTCLTGQPYVVGDAADVRDVPWARHRHWDDLERRVAALTRERDGTRVISAGQAHDLRSALFRGHHAADARLAMVSTWLGEDAVRDLTSDGSLFWEDGVMRRTGLLDAMNAAPFLPVRERA